MSGRNRLRAERPITATELLLASTRPQGRNGSFAVLFRWFSNPLPNCTAIKGKPQKENNGRQTP